MMDAFKIKNFMSKVPYTIDSEASLNEVLSKMRREDIHHLPVLEKGRLCGVITHHLVDVASGLKGVDSFCARDIMMPKPFVVSLDTSYQEVCMQMAAYEYDYVVVLEKEKVVGIFTCTDAIRSLCEMLQQQMTGMAA